MCDAVDNRRHSLGATIALTPTECDRQTDEMMMFLMQLNCADLPIIDGFDLRPKGILQFYSGLDVPIDKASPEQHRILYFVKIIQDRNNLITDFGFLA